MPALVKSKFGAVGSRLAEGTMVCRFSRKKSKNDCLISEAFMIKRPDAESRRSAKNCGGSRGTCRPNGGSTSTAPQHRRTANLERSRLSPDIWKFFERVVNLDFFNTRSGNPGNWLGSL